jgi:tRNA (guanine37-N1)-methyltransferase
MGTDREAREPGPLRVDVITIFPELFERFAEGSFVGIGRERGAIELVVHDLRRWTSDRHRTVDDAPYGGGPGMVMKPEPLVAAIEEVAGPKGPDRRARVVLMTPQGRRLDQARLEEMVRHRHWVLVCGRYEGVDQRVVELAVDEEISIGDFVLSGGEIPAMVVVEGLVRLLPGVLGNPDSARTESFRGDLLEGPQYTRPPEFRGLAVPEVLRSGNHAAVARWRRERATEITRQRRPDLAAGRSGADGSERSEQRDADGTMDANIASPDPGGLDELKKEDSR